MNMDTVLTAPSRVLRLPSLDTVGAHALALLWIAPLLYACWAAFRDPSAALSFDWSVGWTLDNFAAAWDRAPWLRYIFNTTVLVLTILVGQFVLCTLAAYAFARFQFFGSQFLFMLLLLQLFILPEVLIVENYRMVALLGWTDTVWGMGVPYMASAFGVFLLRQAFKQVPRELEDAARPGRLQPLGCFVACLCAARQTRVSGIRPGIGLHALEQFFVALGDQQFGPHPTFDSGFIPVWCA